MSMKAVVVSGPGGPEVLSIGEVPRPQVKPGCLLIKVAYTALNRADTMQRKGQYPPPPGAPDTLGLECSGVVAEVGENCTRGFKEGDRVMALVSGGAYAEYCVAEEATVMRVPQGMSLKLAASIPEAWLTAYQLLHFVGKVQKGDRVLVHAGASGVGLATIQLAREAGAFPYATASTAKMQATIGAGAEGCVDYTKGPFLQPLMDLTDGEAMNLVLDCVGASYFEMNLEALAMDGRYVIYGSMGGVQSSINLGQVMRKRLHIMGTTLRARPLAYKESLVQALWTDERAQTFVSGKLISLIYDTLDWTRVSEAHGMMDSNVNVGKIVLEVDGSLE